MPSEALTAIEQLCHIRDIEIEGYQQRFARTVSEDVPLLPSIDTDALVIERRNDLAQPDQVMASFRLARQNTVELLTSLRPEQWARRAVFEGYGLVTVRSLAHFLCSHDQQHLAGLQWLLGKLASC